MKKYCVGRGGGDDKKIFCKPVVRTFDAIGCRKDAYGVTDSVDSDQTAPCQEF